MGALGLLWKVKQYVEYVGRSNVTSMSVSVVVGAVGLVLVFGHIFGFGPLLRLAGQNFDWVINSKIEDNCPLAKFLESSW